MQHSSRKKWWEIKINWKQRGSKLHCVDAAALTSLPSCWLHRGVWCSPPCPWWWHTGRCCCQNPSRWRFRQRWRLAPTAWLRPPAKQQQHTLEEERNPAEDRKKWSCTSTGLKLVSGWFLGFMPVSTQQDGLGSFLLPQPNRINGWITRSFGQSKLELRYLKTIFMRGKERTTCSSSLARLTAAFLNLSRPNWLIRQKQTRWNTNID